jgi:predicted GIY-YIG superfamily endonuclease
MILPPKIRFKLINNIKLEAVKKSEYVIYAHHCSEGTYIGRTDDPVRRLQEHYADAFNINIHHYNEEFKVAIRKCGTVMEHYIVALATSEEIAKKKEAAAILFYSDRLNVIVDSKGDDRDYGFRTIDSQIPLPEFLEKKGRAGTTHSRGDDKRKTVTAEIYMEGSQKRLRTIEGQVFRAGLNIQCDTSETAKFSPGDKVRINVALSDRKGTEYLVAAKAATLVLAP